MITNKYRLCFMDGRVIQLESYESYINYFLGVLLPRKQSTYCMSYNGTTHTMILAVVANG